MKDGFKVIDSELHLMEPFDLWDSRLEERYRTRTRIAPPSDGHLAPGAQGVELDGERQAQAAGRESSIIARQGRRHYPEVPLMAKAATNCTPEVYAEGLDAEGIDLAVLSPTMTMSLIRHDDLEPDHALAICRVYNDWAHDFCQADPERFKFWGFVPPHDAELAAQEARRCITQLGAAGVALIQGAINGHLFSDEFFDPLWEEVEKLRVPIGFHISFGGQVREEPRARYAGHRRMEIVANALGQAMPALTTVAELIIGGVLECYPNIQPVIMESCASWLPWLLWRLDEKWETFGQDVDFTLSLKPSDYFRRQCWIVMECEEDVVRYVIDYLGDDRLLLSTDFPHHDSPFPNGIKTFLELPGLSNDSKQKILWDNGARLFGITMPRENAVALSSQA